MTELLPEQRFDSLSPKEAELPLTLVWEPGSSLEGGGGGGVWVLQGSQSTC